MAKMEDSERSVSECMESLNALYMALVRHPFVVAAKTGREEPAAVRESHEHSFLQLLASSQNSATDSQKVVAATFRWLASHDRRAFIKSMFQGHYACASLYTDTRLIETALGVEAYFSINRTADGFAIGEPRALDKDRAQQAAPRPKRVRPPPRNRRGRRVELVRGNITRREPGRPVLDAAERLKLLDALDQSASDDEPEAPQKGSYLEAATRSPEVADAAEADDADAAEAEAEPSKSEGEPKDEPSKAESVPALTLNLPLASEMDWAASSSEEEGA